MLVDTVTPALTGNEVRLMPHDSTVYFHRATQKAEDEKAKPR